LLKSSSNTSTDQHIPSSIQE